MTRIEELHKRLDEITAALKKNAENREYYEKYKSLAGGIANQALNGSLIVERRELEAEDKKVMAELMKLERPDLYAKYSWMFDEA